MTRRRDLDSPLSVPPASASVSADAGGFVGRRRRSVEPGSRVATPAPPLPGGPASASVAPPATAAPAAPADAARTSSALAPAAGTPTGVPEGLPLPALPAAPSAGAEGVGSWGAWRLKAPEGTGVGVAACPTCVQRGHLDGQKTLIQSPEGPFYCARCGHHGDARVDPSRYTLRAPPVALLLELPTSAGFDLDTVLEHLGLDARAVRAAVPDLHLGPAFFQDDRDGRDGHWAPALLLPVRAEAGGPVVDIDVVRFDHGRLDHGRLDHGAAEDAAAPGSASNPAVRVRHARVPGGQPYPWGWEHVTTERVVLTDHPLDALALRGAGVADAVALPEAMNPIRAGGGEWKTLTLIEASMNTVADVVIALRDTEDNHRFEEELGRRLGRERCRRTRWHEHRPEGADHPGAAAVVAAAGNEGARDCVDKASPFPVAGIHELIDVEDRFDNLYEFGLQPGYSTTWPSLDLHYTVKPGQWTLVTGIPGHGKSTLLDALFVNLARYHDWTFGVFSPENQPIERHFASLMEKAVGAPFSDGPTPRITPEQKNATKGWLQQHFKMILPDEEQGNWSLDGVLDLARVLVYRYGIRGLIIDPWNEIEHARPTSQTESEYLSAALTRIRRFARLYGVHIWIVAHPTKLLIKADGKYPVPTPYDVNGGAMWRNKADCALCVYRNINEDDEDVVDIHIQKIRFREVGRVGRISLRSDIACGRYIDDIDQEKRAHLLQEGRYVQSRFMRVAERRFTGRPIEAFAEHEDPFDAANWPANVR